MPLQFFGRGSAFADENNSAFFTADNELVIIDCAATAFHKVKKTDLFSYDNIYVLVTHTHEDHVGGIGTLIHFTWFMSKMTKRVTVVAPSAEVREDMRFLLERVDGCESSWYELVTADELDKDWFVSAIPTSHAKTLEGRCFGYQLKVDGVNTVFTGDTALFEPFKQRLTAGSRLYTEVSCFRSDVHLFADELMPELIKLAENGVEVFLMHLDDEERVKELTCGTPVKLAPLCT